MRRLNRRRQKVTGEDLFIGIDLHKARWNVTIRNADVELFCRKIWCKGLTWDAKPCVLSATRKLVNCLAVI